MFWITVANCIRQWKNQRVYSWSGDGLSQCIKPRLGAAVLIELLLSSIFLNQYELITTTNEAYDRPQVQQFFEPIDPLLMTFQWRNLFTATNVSSFSIQQWER